MIAAIGDIHGCFCELRELLQYIKSKNPELTVFIGDYIDRGPDVKSVIDLIIKYSETNKTVFLYGNHEDMAIDAIYDQERYKKDHWFTQGGLETVSSLTGKKCTTENVHDYIKLIPEKYINFLNSLEKYYETEKYIFVHAGIGDYSKSLENQNQDLEISKKKKFYNYIWVREDFLTKNEKYMNKCIITGHTPIEAMPYFGVQTEDFYTPFVKYDKNSEPVYINTDTGCIYGKALSCVFLEDNSFEFYSVKSTKNANK